MNACTRTQGPFAISSCPPPVIVEHSKLVEQRLIDVQSTTQQRQLQALLKNSLNIPSQGECKGRWTISRYLEVPGQNGITAGAKADAGPSDAFPYGVRGVEITPG